MNLQQLNVTTISVVGHKKNHVKRFTKILGSIFHITTGCPPKKSISNIFFQQI